MLSHFSCDCFFEVNHHDYRRLHGGAKERDEAHPDRDGKVVVEEPQQVEAARERERHGE